MTAQNNVDDSIMKISISTANWQLMRDEVNHMFPEEACGLLGGSAEGACLSADIVIPVENILHSPVRFRMDPVQQLDACNELDRLNMVLVAIYHSHPSGPAGPSPRDIMEISYLEAVQLIWSLENNTWNCHGFIVSEGKISLVSIERFDIIPEEVNKSQALKSGNLCATN